MPASLENILHVFTGKSSLDDVTTAELQQLADLFPYSGACQYLLAKKLYSENKELSKGAIQKAALHFSDPLWLHFNFTRQPDARKNQAAEAVAQVHEAGYEDEPVEDYPEINESANEKLAQL